MSEVWWSPDTKYMLEVANRSGSVIARTRFGQEKLAAEVDKAMAYAEKTGGDCAVYERKRPEDLTYSPAKNKMRMPVGNGYLCAEQNEDQEYSLELFIGVMDKSGVWHDLAVVRPKPGEEPDGKPAFFEVLVADPERGSFREPIEVPLPLNEETEQA